MTSVRRRQLAGLAFNEYDEGIQQGNRLKDEFFEALGNPNLKIEHEADEERKALRPVLAKREPDAPYEYLQEMFRYGEWAGCVLSGLQVLVTIALMVWLVFAIYIAAAGMYNTRIDYNTNYYDRESCDAHGNHVCQGVDFDRMHAVNLRWVTLAVFTALLIVDVFMVLFIGMLQYLGVLRTNDTMLRDVLFPKGFDSYCNMPGLWGAIAAPFAQLGIYSASQMSIWYNVRHVVWDPFVITVTFAMLGVRYDTKLYYIAFLAFLWNALQFAAQLQNFRAPALVAFYNYIQWKVLDYDYASKASLEYRRLLRWNQARWLIPFAQLILGCFLFSILTVYFAKYPYDSREWYHYFATIIVLINIGLRTLFNFFRWVSHEGRFVMLAPAEYTRNQSWLLGPMNMMSTIVKSIGAALAFSPLVLQGVFILYDLLYFFVPWAIEHGLDGHSNIARIVFPVRVVLGY